jgi:hypothetical protein
MMPCICGDTACPSCGPAQGHNLVFDLVCSFFEEKILDGLNGLIDKTTLTEELLCRIDNRFPRIRDAIETEAQAWKRRDYK